MKKILLFIVVVFFSSDFCFANSLIVSEKSQKIYCSDESYIEIQNDTFKKEVSVSCEKMNNFFAPDNIKSKIYEFNISESNNKLDFVRKEPIIYIPKKLINSADIDNLSVYFYDTKKNIWISLSTDVVSDGLKAKIIHTGPLAVFEKNYKSTLLDYYKIYALLFIFFGFSFYIIYNVIKRFDKKMKKIITVLFLILIIFSGCKNTDIVDKYNQVSQEHLEKSSQAFEKLSEAIDFFNQKNFDQAINSSTECEKYYIVAKNLSLQGKEIADNYKFEPWLVQFKNVNIEAEDIRIEQCQIIKSSSEISKNQNPDEEKITENINKIADLNTKYNKLQGTMTDMQNQHSDFFK